MKETDLKRRAFLRGKSPRLDPDTIRPPWAISGTAFTEKCTRCDECIKACPEKIIYRGDGGYPEVSFQHKECTFCAECVSACQAGAFEKIPSNQSEEETINQAWDLQISFDSSCLSLNAIVCRACADNCDEEAINFKLKLRGFSEPQFSQKDCTGCGACISVCPVRAVKIKPTVDQNKQKI